MRIVRASVGFLLCLALAGCTSGQLKPAVLAFAESTKAADAVLDEQVRSLNEALASEGTRWALASSRPLVFEQKGDCRSTAKRCRLVVLTPGGTEAPFTPGAGYVSALMDDFADYASGLQRVLAATDPAALSKATNEVKDSIVAFSATLENAATSLGSDATGFGSSVSAAAGPLGQIAAITLNRYTDARKAAAIRASVLAMDPELIKAVPIFERTAKLAQDYQAGIAEERLAVARAANVHGPVTKKVLDDYSAAATLYDAVLQAKPSDVFAKLQAAHHSLALAVSGRSLALRDLWPVLNELSADAARAAQAADQLTKANAGQKPAGG